MGMWHGWSVGIWGNETSFFFWRWVKQVKTWDHSYRRRYKWHKRAGVEACIFLHMQHISQGTEIWCFQLYQTPAPIQWINPESSCSVSLCFVVMECILAWKTNKLKFTFRKSITWWDWSSQHHNERRLRVITPTIKPVTELSQTVGATGYYRKSSLHNSPVLRNQTGYSTQLLTVGLSIKQLALKQPLVPSTVNYSSMGGWVCQLYKKWSLWSWYESKRNHSFHLLRVEDNVPFITYPKILTMAPSLCHVS